MIKFKELELSDADLYDNIVKSDTDCCSVNNFGCIYIWDIVYHQKFTVIDQRIVVSFFVDDKPYYSFPMGSGDITPVILEFKKYVESQGQQLAFYRVGEDQLELLKAAFPGQFSYEPLESRYEYIYLAEKLSTYSGKALHSKKNHCNNFEKLHPGWEFVPITDKNMHLCEEMFTVWYNNNAERLDTSVLYEKKALERALANFNSLKLEGGILIHDGTVYGFSIGQMNSSVCFDCNFEKADIDTNGAFPMVCREMTKLAMKNHPELIYINREEDLGIESLRKSKESYKPEFLLKKYLVRWKYE